ncbi:MAG: dodecin domain-containing protein [Planctomycetales bacterium]|nr:dodecin domain-containing protein [Planctomycetales bacterium]
MIVKVIEIVASSKVSWEDAVKTGLAEASQTLRHITAVDVVKHSARVNEAGKISEYRATIHVAFGIEHHSQLIGATREEMEVGR